MTQLLHLSWLKHNFQKKELSKVKALIEERGGVLLEKAVGLDAEHVIRCFEKQH